MAGNTLPSEIAVKLTAWCARNISKAIILLHFLLVWRAHLVKDEEVVSDAYSYCSDALLLAED